MTFTEHAPASEVPSGAEIEGWEGYTVLSFESNPSRPSEGRIHLFRPDRFGGSKCWTPKSPDETVSYRMNA